MQKIADISRLCRECISWQNGQCPGKDKSKVKLRKLPCKNYQLDLNLVSNQDIEPDSKPPSLKDHKLSKPKDLVPNAILPTNKVKADNFKRLAIQRLTKTLDDIRKLGNLSTYNYEWDADQTDAIVGHLHSAMDELAKKFQKK